MQSVYLNLMLLFAVLFVVTTMAIYNFLHRKGEKVNFLWLKMMMISYVDRYREITRKENGRVGILYYFWVLAINLTLLSFFLFLLMG